jgi:hypothetical protein
MAAEDELALPQVPEAKPNDPEDVSWALSTAEAMWARGDHLEGIKWVRKAAEAAGEVEDDNRALELAKSASELATLIARRSRVSHGEGPGSAGGATPEPAPTSTPPTSAAPSTTRSQIPPSLGTSSATPPAPPQSAQSPSRPPPVPSSGRPPPMPSRPPPKPTSSAQVPPVAPSSASGGSRSAPPAPVAAIAPVAPTAPVAAPSSPSQPPRAAPRPLATNDARQGPQAGRGILSNRTAPSPAIAAPAKNAKGRRRSRENLEGEARAAGVLDTAPHASVDGATAQRTIDALDKAGPAEGVALPTPGGRARRRSRPEPEPTIVGRLEDLTAQAEREKSAEEWDAHPTQNLTGDELNQMRGDGDRNTTAFVQPAASAPAARPPSNTVHDPEIQTSQAVRVVVWRDATGVHVAPAGTVVSSITIDAVLVVLEPSADLTAWLSQRER